MRADLLPLPDDGDNAKRILEEFEHWRPLPEEKWAETRASWGRRLRAARYLDWKAKQDGSPTS